MPVRAEKNAETSTSNNPPRKKICLALPPHLSPKPRPIPEKCKWAYEIVVPAKSLVALQVPQPEVCPGQVYFDATILQVPDREVTAGVTPQHWPKHLPPYEKPLTRRMLNGYLASDSHKSSTDESPCSDANGCCPVATLCNLGNTCFLNSVLYTLRFAPFFLHNLHHLVLDLNELDSKQAMATKSSSLGRNIGSSSKSWSNKDILSLVPSNLDKTNVQISTEELHVLYESLHSSEIKEDSEPFHADTYLNSLRMVNPIFEGNQQHDAHELLVCLLNNIRETCQVLSAEQARAHEPRLLGHPGAAAANGNVGVRLDLAVLQQPQPPPVTAATNATNARWGVRKSWKKKKEKGNAAAMEANDGLREDRELDSSGDSGSVCGTIGLTPLSLIAEDCSSSSSDLPPAAPSPGCGGVKQPPPGGHNFIAEDFEGMSVLLTTCLECEHTTMRKEAFCDICVPVTVERKDDEDSDGDGGSKTVSGVFQSAIVTSEHLRDLNKYWCEQCLRLNEARRSVRYETLPKLLVLQLKRFSSTFNSIVSVSKINDYMPTPLTLACFCVECCHLPEDERPHLYTLYGIIMHLGATIASGHYVAYVKASDNSSNYHHCDRDKRKAAGGLGASGGKGGGGGGNPCDKVAGGFFKFFRQKSSTNAAAAAAAAADQPPKPAGGSGGGNSSFYSNVCRSLDCCGIKLNRSFVEGHGGLNGDVNGGGCLPAHENGKGGKGAGEVANDGGGGGGGPAAEPVWLECDDETVKPLTLKEFEEVLAPKLNRRSAQTPYLLFYSKCR